MEPAKSKKKPILPVILAIIVLASLGFGISKYIYAQHHEDTDDAQVDNDISPVLARVSGYVEEIRFEDNQLIHSGDTLIKLDDRDFVIKIQQANAALSNAEANIKVAEANVTTARANLATAHSTVEASNVKVWRTKKEYDRYGELTKGDVGTQQQYDNVKAEKESAEAAHQTALNQQQAAEAQVQTAEQQVKVAQSVQIQKKADVDFAMLQLSYTNILAPASGTATRKNVQPGQFVNAGSPLFSIVSDNSVYIVANFKETQLTKMKEGLTAEIKADAFPDEVIEGVVYRMSAATGARFSLLPPDNATGNYVKVVQRVPVKIKLKGSKEVLAKLKPGMSVHVSVHLD